MRELKFRAWHKKSKQMFTSDTVNSNLLIGLDGSLKETYLKEDVTDEFVLMQYTGLKDKNGKEIYEGDLIVHDNFPLDVAEVVFTNGSYYCRAVQLKEYHKSVISVVGNVYETPESIEGV